MKEDRKETIKIENKPNSNENKIDSNENNSQISYDPKSKIIKENPRESKKKKLNEKKKKKHKNFLDLKKK